jgi:hypothetical protein
VEKPSLAALASSGLEGTPDPKDEEDEPQDPKVQAASLVREAIEDGDDEALAEALKSFMTMHSSSASDSIGGRKPTIQIHLMKGE